MSKQINRCILKIDTNLSSTLPIAIVCFGFSSVVESFYVMSVRLREFQNKLGIEKKRWVINNGRKNKTNGVYQHHFNYLNIYLFSQLGELKQLFLRFLDPNLSPYTQFEFILRISSQFSARTWAWVSQKYLFGWVTGTFYY